MTNVASPKASLTIRLVFKLERAEHPRLYDELIRFHKGVKRVNRLRVLAYDGLLAQNGVLVSAANFVGNPASADAAEEGAGVVTNDLFAPAIET